MPAFPRSVVVAAILLGLSLSLLGCEKSCVETCRRIAECKLQAKQGDKMLGEGSQGSDPTCMKRCEAPPPDYTSCEGKYRDCNAVLACIPY